MYFVARQWKCVSSIIEIGGRFANFLQQMYDDVVTACVNVVYFLLLNFPGVTGYACPLVLVRYSIYRSIAILVNVRYRYLMVSRYFDISNIE